MRLLRRYQQDGAAGLLNRHQGQLANNRTPQGLAARALGLIRDNYADFGPTLACEKLRERHGIDLAKETARRIMIDAGFWVPKKLRRASSAWAGGTALAKTPIMISGITSVRYRRLNASDRHPPPFPTGLQPDRRSIRVPPHGVCSVPSTRRV